MKRLFPSSLLGQTLAIVLLGLAVSQFLAAWIYDRDRQEAVRAVGGLAAAQRVANIAHVFDESPPESRPRLSQLLSEPSFRVSVSASPPTPGAAVEQPPAATAIAQFVSAQFGDGSRRQIMVDVSGFARLGPPAPDAPRVQHPEPGQMGRMMGMAGGAGPMGRGAPPWRQLSVTLRLDDGQWLTVLAGIPDRAPAVSWWFVLSLAVMGVTVFAASAWAVRRVSAPLGMLAEAATRFGRDIAAEPLLEIGPSEIRHAAKAFNEMQRRLRRMIDNRTTLLAAVSHDLRTPLTLLRLRTDAVEDGENRDRILATLDDMEATIGATLAFARDATRAEPSRPTDLAALLASIVDDLADAGLPVILGSPTEPVVYDCQPAGLKRLLTNLIDNAVKFGKAARATIAQDRVEVTITIEDDGPGIPDRELARVFEPFYRVEGSRSTDTGGAGLGLAVAHSIAQNHGGQIVLANRPSGGLRAGLVLPRHRKA